MKSYQKEVDHYYWDQRTTQMLDKARSLAEEQGQQESLNTSTSETVSPATLGPGGERVIVTGLG